MTPKSKQNEKIFVNEESDIEEQENIDVAIEETIIRTTRIAGEKKSLHELIASITIELKCKFYNLKGSVNWDFKT